MSELKGVQQAFPPSNIAGWEFDIRYAQQVVSQSGVGFDQISGAQTGIVDSWKGASSD